MVSTRDVIKVSLLPASTTANPPAKFKGGTPAHWANANGTAFQNPWPSYQHKSHWHAIKMIKSSFNNMPEIPGDIAAQIPSVRPTWGTSASSDESSDMEKIKATWLGHACFLVELPVRRSPVSSKPSRGARILFDPVFSDRCSPSQLFGPSRFTKPPCDIANVPEVDAIVISHNHYDHLDAETIKAFAKRPHTPHLFAPLGNTDLLRSIGVPNEKIHSLDWWEGRRVEIEVPSRSASEEDKAAPATVSFDVTCTPSQHQSGRALFDRYKTLWASWVVQEVVPHPSGEDSKSDAMPLEGGAKVYFAGDTGYRAVPDGKDENDVPTCPAFKEIGERWDGFDFAMIPIGAYKPRDFMSSFHCAPQDSVRIFKDIRAKKALGMHWGTWVLTTEEVTEPPLRLAEECKKTGIAEKDFGICKLGETTFF